MIKSFLISGSGGQGILSIGTILANIFMLNDFFVTYCSCYGAEMRGGAVNCEINMSDRELYSIQNSKVDFLIALNQASLDKFISKVKENGTIIVPIENVKSAYEEFLANKSDLIQKNIEAYLLGYNSFKENN